MIWGGSSSVILCSVEAFVPQMLQMNISSLSKKHKDFAQPEKVKLQNALWQVSRNFVKLGHLGSLCSA